MREIKSGIVVTGRIRLARNISGYNFASTLTDRAKAKEIINRTYSVIKRFGDFTLYEMDKLDPATASELKERYVISEALRKNRFSGAVAVDGQESLSVMINEEDHIRGQCLVKGADLVPAYKKLYQLDRWLDNNLRYCKKEGIGYLTACPTNLGTGLRASVMMFLPALTKKKLIPTLYESATKNGLTIRGVFGEGSGGGESCLYQVSNEVTLGRTEGAILGTVEKYVVEVADIERLNQMVLYNENRLETEDRVFRSLGLLTHCRRLSYGEFSALIADLKMGAMLDLIRVKEITAIDDLLVTARPATLANTVAKSGETCDNGAIDAFRAQYVANCLKKIII